MLDDRDHRPSPAAQKPLYRRQVAEQQLRGRSEDDIGCAFWAAAMAGALMLVLAGYGLAALVDGATGVLMAVLP